MLNYIGNYDYYLDKKDAMEQAHLQTETKVSDVTASATATASDTELSDPANGNDVAKLQELSKKRAENDARLEELMQRWESLSE